MATKEEKVISPVSGFIPEPKRTPPAGVNLSPDGGISAPAKQRIWPTPVAEWDQLRSPTVTRMSLDKMLIDRFWTGTAADLGPAQRRKAGGRQNGGALGHTASWRHFPPWPASQGSTSEGRADVVDGLAST